MVSCMIRKYVLLDIYDGFAMVLKMCILLFGLPGRQVPQKLNETGIKYGLLKAFILIQKQY